MAGLLLPICLAVISVIPSHLLDGALRQAWGLLPRKALAVLRGQAVDLWGTGECVESVEGMSSCLCG